MKFAHCWRTTSSSIVCFDTAVCPVGGRVERNAARSGNIYVVFNPGWFINDLDGLSVAVVHGSPWRYDTYVPILFAGNGIKPQTVSRRVHTVDVALTLATAVGTKPPSGAAGEVLLEVLGQ